MELATATLERESLPPARMSDWQAARDVAWAPILGSFAVSRFLLAVLTVLVSIVRRQPDLRVWQEWDTRWYLGIAQHGYHWGLHGKPALAFFPLYPVLLRLGMATSAPALALGIVVSNLAFIAASVYLYHSIRLEWGDTAARRAIWLVALFPTAFFTFAPYTESLFLLCASAAMYHAARGHGIAAGLWAGGAVLTRSTGIIVLPAALLFLRRYGVRTVLLALIPPLLTLVGYLIYVHAQGFQVTALLGTQRSWHRALTFPWTGFTTSITWLVQYGRTNPPWAIENILQLATTVVFLALTCSAWPHLSRPYRVYCTGFWLLVLTTPEWMDRYYAPFSSMDRFVLALFPLAGWAATCLTRRQLALLLGLSALLMVGSATVHLFGGWVG